MKKPWVELDGGRQLEAFLGARGMRTSDIRSTDELIQTAAGVFEIPMEPTCKKMADAISSLSKSERRRLARKNIGSERPSPRKRSAKSPLKALADELGVDANHLRSALVSGSERQKTIIDCQTKTQTQRLAEARRGPWSYRRG